MLPVLRVDDRHSRLAGPRRSQSLQTRRRRCRQSRPRRPRRGRRPRGFASACGSLCGSATWTTCWASSLWCFPWRKLSPDCNSRSDLLRDGGKARRVPRSVARDGGEAKFVVVSHLEMTSVVLSPGCGSSSSSSSTSFSSTSPLPPLLSFTQVVTLGSAGPEKQDL